MSFPATDAASIEFELKADVARVTIRHQSRFNAMSRVMWRQLRSVFESIQRNPSVRCVLVAGDGAHFCAGGDISEYADFRFQQASLRDFHENDVWGSLQAMLECDVPIVAQIQGNCMGAGVEIASCCDIRLAGASARFGAPIARLGFPMAPRETALVARELGLGVARQMLLEATIFNAADRQMTGFISRVLADGDLAAEAQASVLRIVALAPQAARLNKHIIRASFNPIAPVDHAHDVINTVAFEADNDYAYAATAEHREGIGAFLEKRKPVF